MQLSLVEQLPELDKRVFLDVFAIMYLDPTTRRPLLKTIGGQSVPCEYKVKCAPKAILLYPEGTIYKLDVRLVNTTGKKPYFTAIRSNRIQRAIEFFDYNLQLQYAGRRRKKAQPRAKFVPH